MLKSSHRSIPTTIPSPMISEQITGNEVVQEYPTPEVQSGLQPSPSRVFPSSHCSFPRSKLSPQIGLQTDIDPKGPIQCQPVSTPEQSLVHPEAMERPLSSHISAPILIPSPHIGLHIK